MNRLIKIIEAAALHMPRKVAKALCANLKMGLDVLEDEGADRLQRFGYVHPQVQALVDEFDVPIMLTGDCASDIVDAWDGVAPRPRQAPSEYPRLREANP